MRDDNNNILTQMNTELDDLKDVEHAEYLQPDGVWTIPRSISTLNINDQEGSTGHSPLDQGDSEGHSPLDQEDWKGRSPYDVLILIIYIFLIYRLKRYIC